MELLEVLIEKINGRTTQHLKWCCPPYAPSLSPLISMLSFSLSICESGTKARLETEPPPSSIVFFARLRAENFPNIHVGPTFGAALFKLSFPIFLPNQTREMRLFPYHFPPLPSLPSQFTQTKCTVRDLLKISSSAS